MSDIDHIAAARALIEPLTGYTPGPWRAVSNHPLNACANVRAGYHDVATLYGSSEDVPQRVEGEPWGPHPIRDATSRLIAAAPALRDMVATLADEAEADAAEIVSLQDLNTALVAEVEKLRAENQRLRKIIEKMDEHSPRADHTCAEPGITLSEAVMRAWPELAEPNDEVSE